MEKNTIKNGEELVKYLNKSCNKKNILHRYKVFDSEPIHISCDFSRFECEKEDFWSYVEYVMENKEE